MFVSTKTVHRVRLSSVSSTCLNDWYGAVIHRLRI